MSLLSSRYYEGVRRFVALSYDITNVAPFSDYEYKVSVFSFVLTD